MIISASRRTDIPAYYSEWFFNRIREGYVLVRNPFRYHQVSRIDLSPDTVDRIVFWTKNPAPMMGRLDELEQYSYYFQFTLNAYGRDAEPGVPSKRDVLIPAFQELSRRIGRERVIWRYDPIFFSQRYTAEYHCRYFEALAARLGDYTERCTVSFLDYYRNTAENMRSLGMKQQTAERQYEILQKFSDVAKRYGFVIDTCAETADFSRLGIRRARCIDLARLKGNGKYGLDAGKDPGQREVCGCAVSIDIGAYSTCGAGCLYCYANGFHDAAGKATGTHNPASPLLSGEIGREDVIRDRKAVSYKECQLTILAGED